MTAAVAAIPDFWRREAPTMDDLGHVVEGGFWRHQDEWWRLPNFIRGLVTGYGGGKTFTLAKRMVSLALENAPVAVATVSPTYPMALRTIVESIDELLAGRQTLEGGKLTYHLYKSQPYRFVIRYGSRVGTILCYSGEHPHRLKGPNLGAAGIDEPFIQEKAVFDQVLARVRHPRAKRREINLTGTPEGVTGWGFDLFEGELREKHDVGLVQCSSRENLSLPPDYVDRLESAYDDTARAAYVDGKFVNMAAGRIYHSFDPTTCVVDEDKVPDGAEVSVGMDFNVDPMSYVVFWRKGDRLHVIAEKENRDSDAEECSVEIRQNWPQVKIVYPDASGSRRQTASKGVSDHDNIRSTGLRIICRAANPPIRDRINAVNGAFRHGRVTISPTCRKLRSYLLGQTYEKEHKQSGRAMSHLLDALGYPVAYLMPVSKPKVSVGWVRP